MDDCQKNIAPLYTFAKSGMSIQCCLMSGMLCACVVKIYKHIFLVIVAFVHPKLFPEFSKSKLCSLLPDLDVTKSYLLTNVYLLYILYYNGLDLPTLQELLRSS